MLLLLLQLWCCLDVCCNCGVRKQSFSDNFSHIFPESHGPEMHFSSWKNAFLPSYCVDWFTAVKRYRRRKQRSSSLNRFLCVTQGCLGRNAFCHLKLFIVTQIADFRHSRLTNGTKLLLFFKKMGQSRPLFVYFCSFLVIISIRIEKSIDGVLGIWTRGRRMVGAGETTELWRPPLNCYFESLIAT